MEERRRVRLTKYSTEAGSASKFAPGDLEQALEGLSPESLEGFVSGMETRDDAGYVPFGGGLLLQSVDFFPPVVDAPYRFDQIAAANALSDVYGEPLTAMNLVAFPSSLDLGVLREILAGRVEGDGVGEEALPPLFDPQTSGGLLLTAPEDRAWKLVRLLHQDGVSAAVVGEVVEGAGVRATA